MREKLRWRWKPFGIQDDFLSVFLRFISPIASLQTLVLNFAIHYGDSAVSAFISNPTVVHGTPSAPHRPPIPCTSGSWDEILEGEILLHPVTLT